MLGRLMLGALIFTALGLLSAGTALAAAPPGVIVNENNPAGHKVEGTFDFKAKGDHVYVSDLASDGWSTMVELWWDGKLRRTCWDVYANSTDESSIHCNFDIPEGKLVTFYLTQARDCRVRSNPPSRGCRKRRTDIARHSRA